MGGASARLAYVTKGHFVSSAVRYPIMRQQTLNNKTVMANHLDDLRRWIIVTATCVLVFEIVGLIATFLMKNVYEARASIYAQSKSSGINLPGDLPGLLPKAGPDPVNYGLAVLQSDNFNRQIIIRQKLLSNPAFSEDHTLSMEKAVLKLGNMVQTDDNNKGLINISVRSSSARFSADIANAYADQFIEKVTTTNKSKRVFIEGKIREFQRRLEGLENRLSKLSAEQSVVDLPEQTKADIQQMYALQAQVQTTDTELKGVESQIKTVGNLNLLAQLKSKDEELRARKANLSASISALSNKLSGIPAVALEHARLERQVELNAKLSAALSQQHQMALIDEQANAAMYQIVDRAFPPAYRVRPRLSINLAICLMLGITVGIALNIIISDLRREEGLSLNGRLA